MKKHAAALILLATFILLSACSHHAMKSTPVAFREHSTAEGPVEDRVNLWPLFYQRDPAWSALWPLIAASDEGSAVLPFYEYDRNDKDLRVGTVTQLAPPLMRFDEKDDNWRIFNIAKDNKHHEFRVMPLYFQDSDEPWYLLVPVFYWNRDDKVFWTPPYLKYPDGGALFFPLLHWKKDQREKQIDLFWPLVGARSQDYKFSKDRGVKALPFFYAEKDPQNNRSTLNILGLGLHAETTTDTLEMQYLIPLGSYEKRGGDDPMSRSRLVPFYLAESSEDKRMFFSLPYSHYQSGDSYFRNILLNAWISVGEGDESYLSLAFPVFHRFADGDDRGHMVAPFYMYYRKDNGDWRFHSTLFNYKSDGTLLNIAGPLYMQAGEPGDLYGSGLWPIYHYWEDDETTGRAVLPLFFMTKGEGDNGSFITPLGGYARSGGEGFRSFLWPVYTELYAESYRDRHILFPLWNDQHGKTYDKYRLLPLFSYESRNNGARYFKSLPFSTELEPGSKYWVVGPWIFERHENQYSTGWEFLKIAEYRRWLKAEAMEWRVFPIAKHRQNKNTTSTEVMDYGLVSLYESHERANARDESHILELLWLISLYDSIEEDDYSRQRVLWRIFHRETQDGVVATDIFPFITWDRNEAKDRFECLWAEGLLGYQRNGDKRRLRFLWLPIPLP